MQKSSYFRVLVVVRGTSPEAAGCLSHERATGRQHDVLTGWELMSPGDNAGGYSGIDAGRGGKAISSTHTTAGATVRDGCAEGGGAYAAARWAAFLSKMDNICTTGASYFRCRGDTWPDVMAWSPIPSSASQFLMKPKFSDEST